jgi:RNA polymerase sigma-70 factor (ECF subfamily)
MLLIDARRRARVAGGMLVRLPDQDRSLWNPARLEEGRYLLRLCLEYNRPGPYQLQAAINAVHSDARTGADTDWRQIVLLYDQLLVIAPGPVIALNRAVAIAEIEGPESALRLIDPLELPRYHLFHAVRADLLRRLGRFSDAAAEYLCAVETCTNEVEREFLKDRYRSVSLAVR